MKRLIASGKQFDTHVYNDDGSEIKGIVAVTYRHRVKESPVLELEILCKPAPAGDRSIARVGSGDMVDVSVPLLRVFAAHPVTGKVEPVRSIVFEDGTSWAAGDAKK